MAAGGRLYHGSTRTTSPASRLIRRGNGGPRPALTIRVGALAMTDHHAAGDPRSAAKSARAIAGSILDNFSIESRHRVSPNSLYDRVNARFGA